MPDENPVDLSTLRNADGLTWAEKEHELRKTLSHFNPAELEAAIDRQYRAFMLYASPNPAAERRQQLFDDAYAASGGLQRDSFVEVAKKAWT